MLEYLRPKIRKGKKKGETKKNDFFLVCWIKEEQTKVVSQITMYGDERRKWVWFGMKREKEEREIE